MIGTIVSWFAALLLALALIACAYTMFAALQVRNLRLAPGVVTGAAPDVSILKPLYSAEAGLYENLVTFCTQDYPARIQIVLGVRSPHDPAVPIVQRLIAEH